MREEREESPRRSAEPPPFALEVLPAPPGVLLLRLAGELDLAVTGRIREALDPAVDGAAQAVVLDLTEVAFMDSSVLKELLRARALLAEREGVLAVAAPGAAVRRLLSLTGTDGLLGLTDSRAAALDRVAS